MAIGGAGPMALLALLFGNQWVTEAVQESGLDPQNGLRTPLNWLQYPQWRLTRDRPPTPRPWPDRRT